jgi:hypothetical protein
VERRLNILGVRVELFFAHNANLANLAHDGTLVADGLYYIACTCLTLRTDEGGTFRDTAESLAEVSCTANKGNLKGVLVYVVLVIRWGKYLRLVDVVNTDGLQNLVPERTILGFANTTNEI